MLLKYSQCAPEPLYEELVSYDNADRNELLRHQWGKFQSTLADARENVPYYAESFENAGVRAEDLTQWDDLLAVPTINKRQIAANFPDRITSKKSNRDTWQYESTSGTTDRLMVVRDVESASSGEALGLYGEDIRRSCAPGSLRVGIPPDACSLACAASVQRSLGVIGRAKETINGFTTKGLTGIPRSMVGRTLRRIAYPSIEMNSFGSAGTRVPPEMLQGYVDKLRGLNPTLLSGLPEYLLLIARHIERTNQAPPSIDGLLPEGSLSTPFLQKEIARVFGAPVHEVYGGHEFGSIATTCECRDKMHIMMSGCLVETIRDDRHAAFGELGEIVVTSFTNKAMPLIRYRPGDVGRIYEDYCKCGRQTLLLSVEGRLQDTIVPSKNIHTAQQIIEFFYQYPNIDFAQLVQRSETRCDLLVVEKEDGRIHLKDLSDAAREFLGEEMQVRPRLVSTIKPEESGKYRFVKSKSYKHFHAIAAT